SSQNARQQQRQESDEKARSRRRGAQSLFGQRLVRSMSRQPGGEPGDIRQRRSMMFARIVGVIAGLQKRAELVRKDSFIRMHRTSTERHEPSGARHDKRRKDEP